MDYKEVTVNWLKGLRTFGLVVLGVPSLGFTWLLISETWKRGFKEGTLVSVSEDWLEFWRKTALIILGFLTLGYTWMMISRLEIIVLTSWREKLRQEGHK